MIILIVMAIIFLHMCLIWGWYRYTNNPSVVDVGWASALTISGLIYLNHQGCSMRTAILSLVLIIWGLRLGGYLWWTRIRAKHIDSRYIELSAAWKVAKPLGFFLNFQLQGGLIFLVSISWYFASLKTMRGITVLDVLGLVLFIIALSFESIADIQLRHFKKKFPGAVCDQKLWRLSRHPNYFFEWLVWCSFALFAFSSPYGIPALISPLTLYLIMTRMTIPITENASIQSKGVDYKNYQKVTPMFFPDWKKSFRTA